MPGQLAFELKQRFKRRMLAIVPAGERTSNGEQPLRAELFSTEQLERHAAVLAGEHKIDLTPGPDRLRRRLSGNRNVLLRTYEVINAAAKARRPTAPAAEWLLDNFYLIEDQIQVTRRHLPHRYSRELPRLAEGSTAGYPRIYGVVLELIAHTDGRVDMESLIRFVAAYQTNSPLKIGELWAIPIMLRLALIENLRRVAGRIIDGHQARDQAQAWAERVLDVAEKQPTSVVLVLADMLREGPALSGPFVAEFARRLHGQNPPMAFPLTWIEQRLAEQDETIEHLIQQESQNQAADQVSVGHSIGSLRLLAGVNWREFVEALSLVERTLRDDPSGDYPRTDFATRNLCRHTIERIARRSDLSEIEIAERAISLARRSKDRGAEARTTHVGYYLIGSGRRELEREVRMRPNARIIAARVGRRFPLTLFAGSIALLTFVLTSLVLRVGSIYGCHPWTLAVFAIPLAVVASQWAVAIVNWLSALLVAPRPLPKLEFKDGISPDCRTMVVVPTMLTSPAGIEDALQRLELRFIANRDPHLHFALLTDFGDAPQETMPADESLIQRAREGIEALNQQYDTDRPGSFFLFHRPRRWNEPDGVWMGWERKRGKLQDLNSVLRGAPQNRFDVIVGQTEILHGVKYVITLDADTQLPRDAAYQLVGAMAHPLNRPRVDPRCGRVVEGYAVMQPQVGVSLPSASKSRFARLFAAAPGIDPYSQLVSDVYQDVFEEGSFIGKGIYDVDAFKEVLHDRLPENRILSHDLLEGAYIRAGLISDILVYEDQPSSYIVDARRRHRWIRGDWQISSWLLRRVPDLNHQPCPNPISALSRWKVFDNLRRSVVPVALLLLLLIAWCLPMPAAIGVVVVLTVFVVPVMLPLLSELTHEPLRMLRTLDRRKAAQAVGRQLAAIVFQLMCLPYETFLSLDAMIRTLVRLRITRRNLLEWQTSQDAERGQRADLISTYRGMWIAPIAGLAVGVLLMIIRPSAISGASPILCLWLLAPGVAWWLSRPIHARRSALTAEDQLFLHSVSRRTWRFFERFVGEEDHWLPPDNYQEHPTEVVAHRTSPTNIGLSLLANLAAYDFGYLGLGELIDRTDKTLTTMDKLERYRGHLFNWYDTQTLEPLPPAYVSTVDSGNLAGALLILRRGLIELKDCPIVSNRLVNGLKDTLRVAREVGSGRGVVIDPAIKEAIEALQRIEEGLHGPADTLRAAVAQLQQVSAAMKGIDAKLATSSDEEFRWWIQAAERQCTALSDELTFLVPWVTLPEPVEGIREHGISPLWAKLNRIPRLSELTQLDSDLLASIDANASALDSQVPANSGARDWLIQLRTAMGDAHQRGTARCAELDQLAARCAEFADLDFDLLYNKSNRLLSIGYNVGNRRLDSNHYDLLASEARLASFLAIAQGKLPQEHWFALSRLLVTANREPTLVSWSGSMFEYLMPLTIMPTFEGTLLDQTCRAVVHQQIEYGWRHGVPWGVSESGFNSTDTSLNYQYRAFGIPELGLKRGLADDLVVAPYACVLGLMVNPRQACANLHRLEREKQFARFGFYEAIDYTPSRVPHGQTSATVRSFMAHHQGMSLLALAAVLLDRPMQRRFDTDPMLKASELLLQERIPRVRSTFTPPAEVLELHTAPDELQPSVRVFKSPHTPSPEVHLLSNGSYHRMVSVAGGGYSLWRDIAVTRWREDSTRDCWGMFCYVRDRSSGEFWSSAYQPTLQQPETYEAVFSQAGVAFRRRDHEIDTRTEYSVSPEDDIDLRRVTLTNHSRHRRSIELTSYAEVALATPAAEVAHPAFANLFVQTELIREKQAILCTRRPRSGMEKPPWLLHLMAIQGTQSGGTSYETNRERFIGRGRTLVDPQAMHVVELSGTEGAPLDPIIAIRQVIILEPDETAVVDIVTGMAETRSAALDLVDKYRDRRLADRVFELAWVHSQVVLRQLDATEADAQLYGRLASAILYANAVPRAPSSLIARNRNGQSTLWRYGISGDMPIVLLRARDLSNIDLVRQLIQAHAYWRLKGLVVDLLIWNEDETGYQQNLQDRISGVIAASPGAQLVDRPGGIFVRRIDQIPEEDRMLMQAVARVVLTDSAGSLAEQIKRRGRGEAQVPRFTPRVGQQTETPIIRKSPTRDRVCFNGWGGFTPDGKEYVIDTDAKHVTPAPWANVLANSTFGSVVTESGGAYTWFENAHEYRLTPWHNDAITDISGEAFYIRDEASGHFWSPTPLPARGAQPYVTRHGFGYTVFEHQEDGIETEMWTYVAVDAPVKLTLLKIRNRSGRQRRISLTGYVEWVLGEQRGKNLMHIVTEADPQTKALLARNAYNDTAPGWIAFFNTSEPQRTVSADRTEFLGRNGTPAHPAMLGKVRLSGRTGAGLDPCAAMQVTIDLAHGQEREISFVLGAGHKTEEVRGLIQRFQRVDAARDSLQGVWDYWNHTLGAVHVETPEPTLNFMANGWLLYQTLAARFFGRSGFYQSSGAFGFRDQLQDAMALIHVKPALLRNHLLRCAAHQYVEGDVQHWWHPPLNRGVRTRISDDYLWLPAATARYLAAVGDTGVLDESVRYLEGRALRPDEEAYYDLPAISSKSATLYEHCVCAIEHGLRFGEHGLPLMGAGDWNDGMNLVGKEGRGESVWLAFFLYDVLTRFADVARQRGDDAFAERCVAQAATLRQNIEQHAWDGEWYRRAYFDNGEPLGSASNEECRIDSIPQSWAAITGAGDPARVRTALEAVNRQLVRREAGLIQLFDPPFDKAPLDPGYIRGYLPGIRENGGQYTHAAVWSIMAFAAIGDIDRAWELFTLINPLRHAATQAGILTYKVEPYVVAADIYANPQHMGRGGWTWYTGSAAWMYRLITESLLGLRLEVDHLRLEPRIPRDWRSYKIHYRYRETFYHIAVSVSEGSDIAKVFCDGLEQPDFTIPLLDDHHDHEVEVHLGIQL